MAAAGAGNTVTIPDLDVRLRAALPVRYRAMAAIAAGAGARISEAAGITISRLRSDPVRLRIDRQLLPARRGTGASPGGCRHAGTGSCCRTRWGPPKSAAGVRDQPGGATTAFTYDVSGDLLTSTDPNQVTSTRTYTTPGGHIATISYSGSGAHPVSYTYDAQGTRTRMTDATGTTSYTSDPFGELTSVTNSARNTVTYTYNAGGQPTGITYPLPASATWATTPTVGYGYDNAGRLTSVTDFTGHQITITPDADGKPTSQALGSTGDTVSYTYDATGAPSAIALKNSSSTLQSFNYSNAPDGEILSETDVPSAPGSPASYTYDPQGRVTSMTPGNGSALNYGFDSSGNLTTLPAGATGTYDHAAELTSAGASGTTTTFAYNADGERLTATQGGATIAAGTWNGAGQLTSYNGPAADMTAATYNGDGLRASATTGSGTQNFVWDGGTRLLMDSANAYIYTDGTTPAEQVSLSTGTISYLSADTLGSVRGIISSSGTLTATASYDAWGNPLTSGGLASSTPFSYAGGYTDPTGLIYLINRYYDPGTGQFLSVDPAVGQTGQSYGYAGGNPVNATDPNGLWQVAIPSDQSPWSPESAFRDNFVGPVLGLGGGDTSKEWKFQFPGIWNPHERRIIDLYYSDNSNFGWINETKIGPQSGSDSFTISELFRDREMMIEPGNVCHPTGNSWGGKPCVRMPINGDTWWFRYKADARACQMSPQAVLDLNLCPDEYLRTELLQGSPQINLVYVFYWPGRENEYSYVYAKRRSAIRNALESNTCPNRALDRAGLPNIKFDIGGIQATCNNDPSPWQ